MAIDLLVPDYLHQQFSGKSDAKIQLEYSYEQKVGS